MTVIPNPIQYNSTQNDLQTGPKTSQCHGRLWEIGKEITGTTLSFLTLYKPLSYPVSLGIGALRVGISSVQLMDALYKGDCQKIFSAGIATTVAVISLVVTFFAHPLGMLISTSYDLILEFRNLIESLREGKRDQALQSCLKILGNSLYLAVLLYGGIEITICFFAVQILMGALKAYNEFTQGHDTDPSNPAFSEYVGKLAEKWQFPSDHLPVGAQVGNAHVITWNILNNHFINWVTKLDTQGLKGSLISKLNEQKSLKYKDLTLRDELILSYLQQMMTNSLHRDQLILSLQECSPEFINALKTTIPSHMNLVLSQNLAASKDHNIVIYNQKNFDYLKDQSSIDNPFTVSDPKKTLMNLTFLEKSTKEKFQIINAHIPGNPGKPGKNEFAKYVLTHMKPGYSTIALGDMNFTDAEMQKAFDEESTILKVSNPFKNLAHYNTNISPSTHYANPIDHIWVNTQLPCQKMKPDEVIPGLQSTVDLLHPKIVSL